MLKSLTPVPREPAWIRIPGFILNPTQLLDRYACKYGDIYSFSGKRNTFVFVSDPRGIQQILSANPELFETSQCNPTFETLFGLKSIFLLDGVAHAQQRKLLMPAFHGSRVKTYSQWIVEIVERTTATWQPGTSLFLRPFMQDIALQTVFQVAFGSQLSPYARKLRRLFGEMLDLLSSSLGSAMLFFQPLQVDWGRFSPWGRILQLQAETERLMLAEITARRADAHERDDLIAMLLAARDEKGNPPSVREIRDEIFTLLVAAHETTTSALCWAFYWIHACPEVERRLRAELSDRRSCEGLGELSYLDAVCAETLRIYPSVPTTFPRRLKEDWVLLDYTLDAGTYLIPCIYQLHHRQDLYPEPKQFRPDRFLERKFAAHEYLPFGGGNRRCLGLTLALHEMKLAIATILGKFTLALTQTKPERPVRQGLTLAPRSNLRFKILN